MPRSLLAPFHQLSLCTSALSALPLRVRTKSGAPSLQLRAVVLTIFRVLYVHFEPDLHLLILLHFMDHRNLSPHAPGDLGNLIDDLQLKNLHAFLQSGCWSSWSALSNRRSLCLVTESYLRMDFSHLVKELNNVVLPLLCGHFFESVWTWRYVTIRWFTNFVFVQHVRNPPSRHLPPLHVMNLHAVLDVFGLLEPASVPPRAVGVPMN